MLEPVIPNVNDWPIAKIAKQREKILQDVVTDSIMQIYKTHPKSGAIRELIAKTLYLERIRIKNDAWKVDPEDEGAFWGKVKKKLANSDPSLIDKDEAAKVEQELLRDIVRRFASEIIGNFDPKLYWFAQQTLPHFFARLLNASSGSIKGIISPKVLLKDKLFVTGPVEKIRQLSTKGTIILVPTHFSNLDSVMIGFGMDMVGLPAFQYGAGLNLFNNRALAFFMGNLGAYKLDRRKKNGIYLETLKAYSRVNVYNGAHTIFFPGGTRSRNGAIEKDLKLGLVGTVIDAQRQHFENNPPTLAPKIFIVPLTMSYHFVLEASSLIEEHLKRTGKEQYLLQDDQFVSWKAWLKFFWETFAASSDITLSMGDPMDIFGNTVDDDGVSIDKFGNKLEIHKYFTSKGVIKNDPQRDQEYTRLLGEILVEKFKSNNTVYSSHLVSFVAFELMKKKFHDPDVFTVLRLPEEDREINWNDFVFACNRVRDEVYRLNNLGKIKIAPHMTLDMDDVIAHGIRNVGLYHGTNPLEMTKEGNITSSDLKLLYFYHNRLDGYGLHKCI
jgi:glycerol-3-phosphate O-acyltransferase